MQAAEVSHMDSFAGEPLSITSQHVKRRGIRRHTTFDDQTSSSNECDCDTCLLGFDDTQADGVAKTRKLRPSAVCPPTHSCTHPLPNYILSLPFSARFSLRLMSGFVVFFALVFVENKLCKFKGPLHAVLKVVTLKSNIFSHVFMYVYV